VLCDRSKNTKSKDKVAPWCISLLALVEFVNLGVRTSPC